MRIEIRNKFDARVLCSLETDSIKPCLEAAIKSGANLSGASLYGFFCFGPGGSRNTYTWGRWENDGYMVHCGCQTLEIKDFEMAVKKTHGSSYHAKWYLANVATMKVIARESRVEFQKAIGAKKVK